MTIIELAAATVAQFQAAEGQTPEVWKLRMNPPAAKPTARKLESFERMMGS